MPNLKIINEIDRDRRYSADGQGGKRVMGRHFGGAPRRGGDKGVGLGSFIQRGKSNIIGPVIIDIVVFKGESLSLVNVYTLEVFGYLIVFDDCLGIFLGPDAEEFVVSDLIMHNFRI